MEKKSYAASEQTKRAMAEALKTLMAQKPLEKITIQELMEPVSYTHLTLPTNSLV